VLLYGIGSAWIRWASVIKNIHVLVIKVTNDLIKIAEFILIQIVCVIIGDIFPEIIGPAFPLFW
jgi:hypothetical protein